MKELTDLLNKSPGILLTIAIVGVFVALLAATMASTKDNSQRYLDLKRIAESCLSSSNCKPVFYMEGEELHIKPDYMKPRKYYGVKSCKK